MGHGESDTKRKILLRLHVEKQYLAPSRKLQRFELYVKPTDIFMVVNNLKYKKKDMYLSNLCY